MATYSSYKKIIQDNISSGAIVDSHFSAGATSTFGVKWFYGSPGACTNGCCCLWTVPTGVTKLHIQMWGAGGNGHGQCSYSRCHHFQGAQGGYYNSKTISASAGWTYTVCAAGVYPCYSQECTACCGCSSYVTGCNLSNFCALGGATGRAETSWNTTCNSYWDCCLGPGSNGGEFGFGVHTPAWSATEFVYDRGASCHCYNQAYYTTSAPLIGTQVTQSIRECWVRCGCWTVPYGHGGQGAMGTYCDGYGNWGQGGTGGGGLVKITYF